MPAFPGAGIRGELVASPLMSLTTERKEEQVKKPYQVTLTLMVQAEHQAEAAVAAYMFAETVEDAIDANVILTPLGDYTRAEYYGITEGLAPELHALAASTEREDATTWETFAAEIGPERAKQIDAKLADAGRGTREEGEPVTLHPGFPTDLAPSCDRCGKVSDAPTFVDGETLETVCFNCFTDEEAGRAMRAEHPLRDDEGEASR